jgi:2',3'-cyclic-nucleotide 2'-phosphodiesterase (5'-nucleotidase family)
VTQDPNIKRVRLFHFNDFHRRLKPLGDGSGGAARLVGKIKELEADNPDAITVNLGDVAGDNTAQGPDHFHPIPELFNQADVDILALGNHEFEDPENGYQNLQEGLIKPFKGEVLVANVTHADGKPIEGTKPYTIRQLQNQSIAFIGVVTRELGSAMFPAAGAALTTMPIEDTLRELIPQVKAEGADAVVVLGHENLNNMKKIAKNVPGVDLALAAHDHRATDAPEEVVRADGTKSWVAEADAYGRMVGQIDLLFDGDEFQGVEGKLHRVDSSSPTDPEAQKLVENYQPGPRVKLDRTKKRETKVLNSFAALADHFAQKAESKETK